MKEVLDGVIHIWKILMARQRLSAVDRTLKDVFVEKQHVIYSRGICLQAGALQVADSPQPLP